MLGVSICVTILATGLASPLNHNTGDMCPSVLSAAGLNATTLKEATAHGIHSITVEDLRYYFNASVHNENNIPSVNPTLNGTHVFPSAPFGGSEFQSPGMRMMDLILSGDDGTDNFMIRGVTPMEKIAHGMHMLEVWQKTSQIYQKVKQNPPKHEVCSCVTDEASNGILKQLTKISIYLRNFGQDEKDIVRKLTEEVETNGIDGTNTRMRRSPNCYSYSYNVNGCQIDIEVNIPALKKRSTDNLSDENEDEMPELKDPKSWSVWKAMLKHSMLDEDQIYHLATYLYCKIHNLHKY